VKLGDGARFGEGTVSCTGVRSRGCMSSWEDGEGDEAGDGIWIGMGEGALVGLFTGLLMGTGLRRIGFGAVVWRDWIDSKLGRG
jgi:hypothetical protein